VAPVVRLGHIAIHARSPETLVQFYQDLLGMQVVGGDLGGHLTFLAIDAEANPHDLSIVANPRLAHTAFYVATLADLRAFHQMLKDRGIAPRVCQLVSIGVRLELLDPEGNVVELIWLHGRACRWPYFRDVDLDRHSDDDIEGFINTAIRKGD
jgi:catechol-2,3-dioxygenase